VRTREKGFQGEGGSRVYRADELAQGIGKKFLLLEGEENRTTFEWGKGN